MPTPQFGWQPQLTCPQSVSGPWTTSAKSAKAPIKRKREPVARRLGDTDLLLHVVREVRQRVTLLQAALLGDQLVAAGERNRLERDERDLLRILERKADDRSDLVVVDAVDQRGNENDVNAGFVQVVDRAQLYVEQVADLAVRVGIVADTVELQIYKAKPGFGGLAAKFF